MKMEINMQENFLMMKWKEKGYIIMKMEINMKGNFQII